MRINFSSCVFFEKVHIFSIDLLGGLFIEIAGYTYAAPCELRGDRWRIITAYPSRKYHKIYSKS